MPFVNATINLKEPAHYMGENGEIFFTIHPGQDGKSVLIDFDFEPCKVEIAGKVFLEPMVLEIKRTS